MTNLSGLWKGAYSYPRRLSATSFDAELRDHEGKLSGMITEVGDSPRSMGVVLRSTMVGELVGTCVTFTKIYDDVVRAHMVWYEGELIEEGQAIEGTWRIGPRWSGPFRMERRTATETTKAETFETVEID